MTVATRAALSDAVVAYARRLHAEAGSAHHVASPLGAWLVLALVGAATHGPETEGLAEVLGMPTADAADCARLLLDDPHPAVAAAAAAWTDRTIPLSDGARRWLAALPASVEQGPVPSQTAADAWARERTFGMIERFPLRLGQDWSMVLASALATRIDWSTPFETTGAEVFRSAWRDRVSSVLRTPERGHVAAIARHPEAGDVAVHQAHAEGLRVTSVVAGPDVPPSAVLAAAHDIARGTIVRHALRELPLGDGPAWTITAVPGQRPAELFAAVLPAWSARSEHELGASSLGFQDAVTLLGRIFDIEDWDARQAATAQYRRTGFAAAAVTVLGVRAAGMFIGEGRAALLRFDRPYAVVATATGTGAWADLPVFSAWVTEPEDAAAD